MALKTETISSIQPFWHIDCPLCGGTDFTEYGTGGGVYCDRCNTKFNVSSTGGDSGCVVHAVFSDVYNMIKTDGTREAWRKVLMAMGCYVKSGYYRDRPIVAAYRIMKEPDDGTYCTDDREWILGLKGQVLDKDVPDIVSKRQVTYLTEPMVSVEVAIAAGLASED